MHTNFGKRISNKFPKIPIVVIQWAIPYLFQIVNFYLDPSLPLPLCFLSLYLLDNILFLYICPVYSHQRIKSLSRCKLNEKFSSVVGVTPILVCEYKKVNNMQYLMYYLLYILGCLFWVNTFWGITYQKHNVKREKEIKVGRQICTPISGKESAIALLRFPLQ